MVEEEVVKSLPVSPQSTGIIVSQRSKLIVSLTSLSVARSCSLLFIVLDVLKPLGDKAVIENELEGFGIRLVSI